MNINPFRALKRGFGISMGDVKRFQKWAYGQIDPPLDMLDALWNEKHGEELFIAPDYDVLRAIAEQYSAWLEHVEQVEKDRRSCEITRLS